MNCNMGVEIDPARKQDGNHAIASIEYTLR